MKKTEPPTPSLIEKSHARGEISRYKADLYLAYALGDHHKLPTRYKSSTPWDGTLPLLELRERIEKMEEGPRKESLEAELLAPPSGVNCSGTKAPSNSTTTSHFRVDYPATIGGGLTISDYTTSLETSWTTEINSFGWAAPPFHASSGGRYHVIVGNLSPSLYGFVSSSGTYAGLVGNNPNTAWSEPDATASCMVLNDDYSGFGSSPQDSLDSTTAHELNHSIQAGYGALVGTNRPDAAFVEGGATWMEDEVFDGANDNYHYLWPDFDQPMGTYTASAYPYWITWRGLTERYGTGTAGAGEQVMEDFWEEVSKESNLGLNAMNQALVNRSTTLPAAYHAYAIAARFMRTCGGGYTLPYCFEERGGYVAEAGAVPVGSHGGSIASPGGSYSGSVADNYALNWVTLPTSATYGITLANTSAGGQLRATVVCDTGTELVRTPMPAVVGAGADTTLDPFDPSGCNSVATVITNQSQTAAEPTSSTQRTYTLSLSGQPVEMHDLSVTVEGGGTITSAPAGIDCGSDCAQSYEESTQVTLTSDPDNGYAFTGWSGACTGSAGCTVTMNGDRSVTATFVDNTPPATPFLHPLGRFRTGTGFTVEWDPSNDSQSGISEYSIQQKTAPPNEALGPWVDLPPTTGTTHAVAGDPGETYCFRVAATNGEGQTSDWSVRRCTSIPLDDRALTSVGNWSRLDGTGYYLETFTRSSSNDALLRKAVTAKRLALVATTCPTCGTVRIFFAGDPLKEISLESATIERKRVLKVPAFSVRRSGTAKVIITSSSKKVEVDGLGASAV